MKSKPNRNLGAAARNRIFVLSRSKYGCPAKKVRVKGGKNTGNPTGRSSR
jgi:hypothetical protein